MVEFHLEEPGGVKRNLSETLARGMVRVGGRVPRDHVRIESASVDEEHGQFFTHAGLLFYRDKSRFGTRVTFEGNAVQLHNDEIEVPHGSTIVFGLHPKQFTVHFQP
jgi:hypothetical protein